MTLYDFTSYLLSYDLRFNRLYRRRAKFLPLERSLFLKLFKLRMLKEIIWVSKKNETLIIKSVRLDLALIIGADSNLIALWKDNASRFRSFRAILVSFRIIMGKNLIQINRTKSYVFVIIVVKRAI